MAKITFKRPDEETLNVYVDGEYMGNVNHDDHGWQGMQCTEQLIMEIAEKLGIEVTEEDENENS
jgi:CO/xanthine dehydrogenase Mo-binding subunit